MQCKHCGQEVEEGTKVCPNCGMYIGTDANTPNGAPKAYVEPHDLRTNTFAVWGATMSFLSLALGVYFMIMPACSVVLSIIGIVKAKRERYLSANSAAYAGLVMGLISLIMWTSLWIAIPDFCFSAMTLFIS